MSETTATVSLAQLMSSYMLSVYAFFVPLPSLTADDLAHLRSPYYREIYNSIPALASKPILSLYSAIRNFVVHPISPESILPWVPRPVKYALLALLIVNCRSFPFNWHIRVWRPLFWIDLKYLMTSWRPQAEIVRRWDAISPIGINPLEGEALWESWASPDECDYNLRFHDSSYAKNWDSARFKDIMDQYNRLLLDGGRLAVAGTNFHYIEPIPIMARYRVKSRIVAWDEKWIYTLAKFVSHPNKDGGKTITRSSAANLIPIDGSRDRQQDQIRVKVIPPSSPSSPASRIASGLPFVKLGHDVALPSSLQTIRMGTSESDEWVISGVASDASTPSLGTSSAGSSDSGKENDDDSEGIFATTAFSESPLHVESDGSTLHCVALSRCCWKLGRITIPPAIALTSVGYGLTTEQWLRIRGMRDRGEMPKFLKGGWRDVKEGDRWWEDALGKEEIDEKRRVNLEIVRRMREGQEGVGSMWTI